MEHSYFNLMLYLFQEDLQTARRLQSWSPQNIYDTRQYNKLSHTHSLILVNTNYSNTQ
jgi:hypothetical protein